MGTSDYNKAFNRGHLAREWVRQTTTRHSTGAIWQGSGYVRLQYGIQQGPFGKGVNTSDYNKALNRGHFSKGVRTSDYNKAINRGHLGREWVRQTTIRHSTGAIWQGSEYVRLQQGIQQGPFGKGTVSFTCLLYQPTVQ